MRQRRESAAAQNTFHLKDRTINEYKHNGRNKENKYCLVVLSHAYSLKGRLGVAVIMHPKTNQRLDFKQGRQIANRRDYMNKMSVCKRMGKTEGNKKLSTMSSSDFRANEKVIIKGDWPPVKCMQKINHSWY